jgi:hypothetical protein
LVTGGGHGLHTGGGVHTGGGMHTGGLTHTGGKLHAFAPETLANTAPAVIKASNVLMVYPFYFPAFLFCMATVSSRHARTSNKGIHYGMSSVSLAIMAKQLLFIQSPLARVQ